MTENIPVMETGPIERTMRTLKLGASPANAKPCPATVPNST